MVLKSIFIILVTASSILSQTPEKSSEKGSPAGSIIKFKLEKDDASQDVGFHSRKSYWKLQYELRLIDRNETSTFKQGLISKYGKIVNGKKQWSRRVSEKFGKGIRKLGLLVAKGSIRKYGLRDLANREIRIPFKYSDKIKKILDNAVESDEKPEFVIIFKTQIRVQTRSGKKSKIKFRFSFFYPFKMLIYGKWVAVDAPHYGASITLIRDGDKVKFSSVWRK